ncbi:MAG TPA: tripartite tricarboxylate transporter substrate-binding protein [Xanthobacteraceae bacterium]|jgi:tripartite-type tricarboxylate transporter receptor subunit TctC|nr:tripartite tricarboxylate transporter substrate-binding protein [Xanthobacteraceae bacterium]
MLLRQVLAFIVIGLLALSGIGPAAAQTWPTRPVTMVVPFPPGGGTDVLGRIVAQKMSEILHQQVIVENVGGAGGMIGSARVAHATPDGYQFVLGSRADAINQTLYKHPLYDFKRDLAPVILVADQPMIIIARKDLPVNGLQEFIAYVKKNQATLRTGSAGIGSTGYVDCALFNQAIGVKVQDIPYRGGGPALQDLIGQQFDYFVTLSPTAVPPVKAGLVKPITMLSPKRLPSLPDLPTADEQGMHFEASTWFAFFVPKGTPAAVIKRLHDATAEAINTPAVQERLAGTGTFVVPLEHQSTEYLESIIGPEIEKNGAPLKAAGLSIE